MGKKSRFLRKKLAGRVFCHLFLLIVTTTFILIFPGIGNSFEKTFRVKDEPTTGDTVFALSDGYLVLTDHNGHQNFTKFDLIGNIVLSKDFFDASGGWPRSAVQTSGGGYLITGLINTTPKKGYVIELDQNLRVMWGKEFSQSGDVWVGSAKETSDGGYIILAKGQGSIEIIKLKFDRSLDWQKRIVSGGKTEVYDIYEVNDGYVIYGSLYDAFSNRNLCLAAIEKNGNAILWGWKIRGTDLGSNNKSPGPQPSASNIVQVDENNLAVAASTASGANSRSITLIPFTATGYIGQVKIMGGPGENGISDLSGGPNFIKLSDGNLLLSGYSTLGGGDTNSPLLMKLTPDLSSILWQYVYTPVGCLQEGSVSIVALSETLTEEIIATGGTMGGNAEAFLVSVSKEGINDQSCFTRSSPSFALDTDFLVGTINYRPKLKGGVITVSGIPLLVAKPLDVSPIAIDFGTICVGYSPIEPVTFTNSDVSPDAVWFICPAVPPPLPAPPFSVVGNDCTEGRGLLQGESCNFNVQFSPTPTMLGPFASTVRVYYYVGYYGDHTPPHYIYDDCALGSYEEVALLGFGMGLIQPVPPPASHDFGSLCVGSSSDHSFTVTNNGGCTYALGTIGSPSLPFGRAGGTCSDGLVLHPGETCSVVVRFLPTSTGSFSSTFLIPWAGSPVNVTVTGTGVAGEHLAVPPSVNFGNVCLESSSDQTITVKNDATCPLPLTLGTIGPLSAPFARIGGTCANGMTLNGGQSCTIAVRFTPTSAVLSNASLSIPWDGNTANVALSGTGVGKHIAAPTNVDFGNVCLQRSSEQTLTVQNDGTCPLILGSIEEPKLPFRKVGGTCSSGLPLNAKGTCTIVVSFSPASTGPSNSGLSVSVSGAYGNTVNVTLSGTGMGGDIVVTPTDVDFGNVRKRSSAEQSLTVGNNGTCPLTLETIGSPSAPFSRVGGTCSNGLTLSPGGTCSIVARFTPMREGSFTSSFNISSNDPNKPEVTVHLKGGSGPDLVGESGPIERTCRNTSRGVRCVITGPITVENIGNADARPACVKFFLSDDGNYDPKKDKFLMQVSIDAIQTGKSEKGKFKLTLPLGQTGTGKFIIAVINANQKGNEANSSNNVVSFPIP